MICQVTNTQNVHRESHEIQKKKKRTKENSEYVTVSKQFKTNEFQNEMFLKPYSSSTFGCQ